MKRFENKVALVTGAASGVGRATAIRLASEGASVYCIDLEQQGLQETAGMIQEIGGTADTGICDVTCEQPVADCLQACIDSFGKLDHLSNMAGILRFDHFHELRLEDFNRIIAVNLTGTFLMCREAIPQLLKTSGNIVNASSTSAMAGVPWAAAYAASKGAVLAMTKTIAVEYANQGLRANCICPGDIQTPMRSPSFPQHADLSMLERCMSLTGAKGPESVAGVIAMLASEDGAHITGESIRMDGGTLS